MADLRPAVNASPLIFLSRGGHLELLRLIASEVIIPTPVVDEISQYGTDDVTARAIASTSWLIVKTPPAIPSVITAWDLGPGESSVLAWGYANEGSEAILDDLAARRCAATLGIPVRGTLGLILLAKERGVIPLARPVIERMCLAGMYLSDSVIDNALAIVGE